jgi:hypothetical protein
MIGAIIFVVFILLMLTSKQDTTQATTQETKTTHTTTSNNLSKSKDRQIWEKALAENNRIEKAQYDKNMRMILKQKSKPFDAEKARYEDYLFRASEGMSYDEAYKDINKGWS